MIPILYPGEIVSIFGPMFSGKSTYLRQLRLEVYGKKPHIFFPVRHAKQFYAKQLEKSILKSHDEEEIHGSLVLERPLDILQHILVGCPLVLIDELVLWDDPNELLDVINKLKGAKFCVVVGSFDTDADGKRPWVVQKVDELSILVLQKRAVCQCGKPAMFTEKLSGNKETIEPEAEFAPRCKEHFVPLREKMILSGGKNIGE